MNKQDVVSAMAEKAGLTKKDSEAALNAFMDVVQAALSRPEEDAVSLVGFGSFKRRARNARTGRNPQTQEAIDIPATWVPTFSPGKGLKDALDEAYKVHG